MKITRQTLPGAWICTNDSTLNYPNHGRRAVQHNKIYLKDGEEFEIELFNPMPDNVLAVISLDGKPISKTGLVLRAGQRVYLDCFYDDKKKFLFRTYSVDNSSAEVQSAIAKNGLVEIQFYKEKILNKYTADSIVHHHHHYNHYNYYPYRLYNPWYWNGLGMTTTGGYVNGTTTTYNSGVYNSGTLTANCSSTTLGSTSSSQSAAPLSVNTDASQFYANVNSVSFTNDSFDTTSLSYTSSPILEETGQVDKGSKSSQEFVSIDMDFEDAILNKIQYQLLPDSKKPAEVQNVSSKKKNDTATKIEQLLELKTMLDQKLITQSEFEDLKNELFN